jgi:hypothetical protein
VLGPQFTRVYVNRAHKGHSEVSFEPAAQSKIAENKARQTIRIRELGSALAADGLVTLDEQARALGLSRSTAWTVLKANHKASGLAAGTINQMLSSPALPPRARATILTYVDEKLAGLYGHNKTQLRRFATGFDPRNRGHSLFADAASQAL